jgi:hypothetical protein
MSSHFSFIVPSISIDTAYNDNLTSVSESNFHSFVIQMLLLIDFIHNFFLIRNIQFYISIN